MGKIVYEIWHSPSANLVADFDSVKEAYDYIKFELNGQTDGLRIDGADYKRQKFWIVVDWNVGKEITE